MKANCGYPLFWHNCYKGTFDVISPSSMAHPAKMAPALCYRILQHLEELGLLKKGQDTVLDPMAGTGITNICAGAMGYPSISVELEDKFVGFQKENKEYAERRLYTSLDWTMVKGDSRRLSELLQGQGLKTIVSPPYADQQLKVADDYHVPITGNLKSKGTDHLVANAGYETEGQIEKLKDKPLKSIVSPPYANRVDDHGVDQKGYEGFTDKLGEYGDSDGQIGKLKDTPLKSIVSPPYGETLNPHNEGDNPHGSSAIKRKRGVNGAYSQKVDNIGNLKDTPLKSIVSPPYGETGVGDWKTGRAEFQDWVINEIKTKGYVEWRGKRYNEAEWRAMNHGRIDGRATKGVHEHPTDGYSEDKENIGNLKDKPLKSIVSPPYGETLSSDSDDGGARAKRLRKAGHHGIADRIEKAHNWHQHEADYNPDNKENIGNLKDKPLKAITSPPYGDVMGKQSHEGAGANARGELSSDIHYGDNPDNIGGLPDKPLKTLTSPPYEDSLESGSRHQHKDKSLEKLGGYAVGEATEGNIGDTRSESYLSAMEKVYSEIALVSDVLCVVVKNPTRNGKIRRLDSDTISILKASGWEIHCQHRALLFEELEQADMFEGSKKQVKGRLSFFKRLSWQNSQPVASWEDILVCVRNKIG